jgi:hypothetical protein
MGNKGYALLDSTTGAVTNGTPCYGGMYVYNKTIAFNIITADVYHAFGLRTAADITATHLSNFTFDAGRIVDANITSEADTGGKLRIVGSAAHGLVNGDTVTLHGMNNAGHNGVTVVLLDGTNPTTEFIANTISYVAGAGASNGSVYAPAYLQAGAAAAGIYTTLVAIDGTAAAANKGWKWELNINQTAQDNIVTERTSTNSLASMATGGIITLAVGDRVWLSGKNITDTSDYTVKNMNIYLHRI